MEHVLKADIGCRNTVFHALAQTGAEYVVSGDPSCLMQIDGYLRRQKLPTKTISLAEVLAAT